MIEAPSQGDPRVTPTTASQARACIVAKEVSFPSPGHFTLCVIRQQSPAVEGFVMLLLHNSV